MKSYSHPNVLSLYASFVAGQDLYMVTPFCAGGSVLHMMKYGHPEVRAGCVCEWVHVNACVVCWQTCAVYWDTRRSVGQRGRAHAALACWVADLYTRPARATGRIMKEDIVSDKSPDLQ
jgi:hypothetical protein